MEMVEGRIEEKGKRGRLNPHAYSDKPEVRESEREEPIPGTHNSKESQAPKKGDDTKGRPAQCKVPFK